MEEICVIINTLPDILPSSSDFPAIEKTKPKNKVAEKIVRKP